MEVTSVVWALVGAAGHHLSSRRGLELMIHIQTSECRMFRLNKKVYHPVSTVINPLMATQYIQVLYMVACLQSRFENIDTKI